MDEVTLKEAKAQGLKRYYTGKPCAKGHVAERITSTRTCVTCHYLASQDWVRNNPEKQSDRTRRWYQDNREGVIKRTSEYNKTHREQCREYSRKSYVKHSSYHKHRAVVRKRGLKHRSFEHEQHLIKDFYANCPEGYHVDHEIPLSHPLDCGLHCLANLQYLTGADNLAKSNSWNQDQYSWTSSRSPQQ